MSMKYNQVLPVNNKDFYKEQDSVDFQVDFPNECLVLNTIKLTGTLSVRVDGRKLGLEDGVIDDVMIDGMVGLHCAVDSISTDLRNAGQIENINDQYPRYVRMMRDATMNKIDTLNSNYVAELCAPVDDALTPEVLTGVNALNNATDGFLLDEPLDPDFCIVPMFCLNRASDAQGGMPTLDYNKSGTIRINIKLSRTLDMFYGPDVSSSVTYTLSNLRLQYSTVPQMLASMNLSMISLVTIKSTLESNFTNLSSRVPGVCRSVAISFISQAHETQGLFNNYETEVVPLVKQVKFLSNGSQDYITYDVENESEILQRYIEAFNDTGKNNMTLEMLKANKSYGIGLDFGKYYDLTSQQFNVQINSGVSSENPMTAYLFFHSLLTM